MTNPNNDHLEPQLRAAIERDNRRTAIRKEAGWTLDAEDGWLSSDDIPEKEWNDYYPLPEQDGYDALIAARAKERSILDDCLIYNCDSDTSFSVRNAVLIRTSHLTAQDQLAMEEGSHTDRLIIADIHGERVGISQFPI